MPMANNSVWLIDGERVTHSLEQARDILNGAGGELVLDFSGVRRIAPTALREMQNLAVAADDHAVKVALRGVNVDVYKVLTLMNLVSRFTFLN